MEQGIRPPRAQARLAINQALWAGTDVGGRDIDTFAFDQIGRLPNDLHARPSTPPTYVPQCWAQLRADPSE